MHDVVGAVARSWTMSSYWRQLVGGGLAICTEESPYQGVGLSPQWTNRAEEGQVVSVTITSKFLHQ